MVDADNRLIGPIRRARMQRQYSGHRLRHPDGTISWVEHLEIYEAYAKLYGRSQTPQRMHERGGFSYGECIMLLGRPPNTWEPIK